jgi:hypothetical protein
MCLGELTPGAARLARELEDKWTDKYGDLMHGAPLQKALGYKTLKAMGKAINRGQIPLPFFSLPSRRGHFVLTKEVACFVATHRATVGGGCLSDEGESEEGTDMS